MVAGFDRCPKPEGLNPSDWLADGTRTGVGLPHTRERCAATTQQTAPHTEGAEVSAMVAARNHMQLQGHRGASGVGAQRSGRTRRWPKEDEGGGAGRRRDEKEAKRRRRGDEEEETKRRRRRRDRRHMVETKKKRRRRRDDEEETKKKRRRRRDEEEEGAADEGEDEDEGEGEDEGEDEGERGTDRPHPQTDRAWRRRGQSEVSMVAACSYGRRVGRQGARGLVRS